MVSNKSSDKDMTMKIVLIVSLLVAFIGGYFVARAKYKPQIVILNRMISERDAAMEKMKTDANKLVMKDGKMWILENGIVKTMDADIVLPNGDKVTVSGKVIKADGTETTLQNGDAVDMEGKLMPNGGAETDTSEAVSN